MLRALGYACAGAGLLGLSTHGLASQGSWDCKVADDGRSWACTKDGIPEIRPAARPAPVVTQPLYRAPAEPLPEPPRAAPPAAKPAARKAPAGPRPPVPPPEPALPEPAGPAVRPGPQYEASNPKAPAQDTARPAAGTPPATPAPAQEAGPQGPKQRAAEPGAASTVALPGHPGLDSGLDWQQCAHGRRTNLPKSAPLVSIPPGTPIEITADAAVSSGQEQRSEFRGGVHLRQGPQQVWADYMTYAHDSGELHASGQTLLQRPDLRMSASRVDYNLQTKRGKASDAAFRWPQNMARGSAQQVQLIDPEHSQFETASYTTCSPGNDGWMISAEQLEIDSAEGLGTAHDATLRFLDTPVAWLPRLTFPIDERRRSGVLMPSVGYGEQHGTDISVPYYFNLAPNYDLTLSPRLMSERGLMLGGELRFLTPVHDGIIGADYLPNDRKDTNETSRYSTSIQLDSRYNASLSSEIRYNQVSDGNFLSDFGGDLSSTATSELERTAGASYQTTHWQASALAQSYQSLGSSSNQPYKRLPQLTFNFDQQPEGQRFAYRLDSEFVHFAKNGSTVQGTRLDLRPSVSLPLREPHYHLVPSASLRYTRYRLDNQGAGLDADPERLAPIFSLDGGLYFDRQLSLFGEALTQSLEPRLYYLYVPRKDQGDIPIFDTGAHGFSFDSLFREDRFNGPDRLGDANQVSLAVTSRFNQDDSGRELLRARLGGTLYLRDREVQLPGSTPSTEDTSALIADLSSDLGNGWSGNAELQWDPNDDQVDKFTALASYADRQRNLANLAYKYDPDNTHTDLGLIWALNKRTRVLGRWNYSISDAQNIETLAGVEYGHCCWRVRTLVRQQRIGGEDELSFWLQLELSGLSKFGDDIDSLLGSSIHGYRKEDD